jgi:hypothetical protein
MSDAGDDPSKILGIQQMLCPKCGAHLALARIEPAQPGYDLRTFECRECGHSETKVSPIEG